MKPEERQKFLIILTIAVVALWAGDKLLLGPAGKWWTARSNDIVQLHKDLAHGKAMIQNEAYTHAQWAGMLTNTLPNNKPLAEQKLLSAFDSWQNDSLATVTGITPQWKNDSTNYMTLNCRVEATGDLVKLIKFVTDIEKDPMALKLDSVEFSTHDNTGQQLTLGLQISGLVLTTFKK